MRSDEDEELERLRDVARSVTIADMHRTDPPAEVWDAIAGRARDERSTAVADLDERRRRATRASTRWFLGAAAAVAVVIALVAALAVALGGDADEIEVVATSTITNEGLPVAFDGSGSVQLVSDDGELSLRLEVPELPDAAGFYELWVIDAEVAGMQSLGIVRESGTFPLPDGLDPAEFPVVDISVEPADGDPTHSGDSVLRGVLEV